MRKIAILIALGLGLATAGNFLSNPGFEEDLAIGWQSYVPTLYDTITRGTGYEPDPDYEAYVYKYSGGYTKLWQTIDINSVDSFSFSIKAKLYAYDNDADTLCWAAAAVIVSYLNSSGTVLGATRICRMTTPCDWRNTTTQHLIAAADTLWHTYSFGLRTELANLPGVVPSQVKKVSVALFDTCAHTC